MTKSEMTDAVKLAHYDMVKLVQNGKTRTCKSRTEAKVPPSARRDGNRFETLRIDVVGAPWEEAEKNAGDLMQEVVEITVESMGRRRRSW